MRSRTVAGILVVAVFATGCGSDDGTASIEGVEWQLRSIDGEEISGPVVPTLLLADGAASGLAGCNRFTGSYTLENDSLEVGPLATTRMACEPEIDDIERAYLVALDRVIAATPTSDGLTLTDADGTDVLAYVAP